MAVGVILAGAGWEFLRATSPLAERTTFAAGSLQPQVLLVVAAMGLLVAGAHNGLDWWTGAIFLSLVATFVGLISLGNVAAALPRWASIAGAILYVGVLGSYLVLLRRLPDGLEWTLLAVFSTFSADTAAYFAGKSLGRTHVAPRISPGKTLEGFAGGFAGCFGTVLLLNWAFGLDVEMARINVLALLLPLAAFLGDLAESLLKRSVGIKDASGLVPGHGGFLDRMDSILFTVPLVYYFVLWLVM